MNAIDTINNVELLTADGKYNKALYLLKPLLKDGYNELALFYMGKIYYLKGKEKLAMGCFDTLIAIDPHYREDIFQWLGIVSLKNNDIENSKKYFSSLGGLKIDNMNEFIIGQAEALFEVNNLVLAEKRANKVLVTDAKDSQSLLLLARIKITQHDYSEAIEYLNKVLDNYDGYMIEAYQELIKIQNELGNTLEAKNYEKILNEIKNESLEDCSILADAYADLNGGSYYQARNIFQYLIDNNKFFKEAYSGLESANLLIEGDNYLQSSYYDEAYKCYKKLFRKKDCLSHAVIGLKLARIFKSGDEILFTGDPDLALATYRCALDEKIYANTDEANLEIMANLIYYNKLRIINNYEVLYNEPTKKYAAALLGNIYLEAGNYDKAKEYYISAIDDEICVADALTGLMAIKINNNDIKYINQFIKQYRNKVSKKELGRINRYADLAKYNAQKYTDEERIENDKILINHIISTQYKRLK